MNDNAYFQKACTSAHLKTDLERGIAEKMVRALGTLDRQAQLRVIRAAGVYYGWLAEPDTYFVPSVAAFELVKRIRKAAESLNNRFGAIQGRSLFNRSPAVQEVEDLQKIAVEIESVYLKL